MPVGLYVVFLLDWLTIFHRDQLLVLRLEDHALNRKYTMNRVFHFLNLGKEHDRQSASVLVPCLLRPIVLAGGGVCLKCGDR